ncbi:hypothetical protein DLM46_00725 [Paraburkholderia lacunae]|uniref:Uncharacterized protein n=1 Tax=Paraburkholderia lacunae TaxID=2211104 RepID=A0A370NFR5_9BURK|nr:hypothetical protein DLM46_00725 [Paraburkholderia lacunae]
MAVCRWRSGRALRWSCQGLDLLPWHFADHAVCLDGHRNVSGKAEFIDLSGRHSLDCLALHAATMPSIDRICAAR